MTLAVDETRVQEVVGSLNRKMLINGEWVDAASGQTFETVNPATEETLAAVAHGQARTSIERSAPPAPHSTTTRPGARCRTAPVAGSCTGSAT
jgi:hypothetical protein